MEFDSKVVLASGVEGLSGGRRRRRTWLWAALLAVLLAALAFVFVRAGGPSRVAALAGLTEGKKDAVAVRVVFQKMGFLPQVTRAEAPAFVLRALDGQNHSLAQHRGKVVLLNFWATWCPPCVREMPGMQRLYDQYHARGFDIVAVSLDQGNPDAVRDFVQKLNLTYPIVLDPEHKVKQDYRVRALPATYLIDRAGRVIAWGMGAREWDGEAAGNLIAHLLEGKG